MPKLLFTSVGIGGVEYDWSWEPARVRTIRRLAVPPTIGERPGRLRAPAMAFAAARWGDQFRALYVYGSETPPSDLSSLVHEVSYYATYSILPWGCRYNDDNDAEWGRGIACMPHSGPYVRSGMHPVDAFWLSTFYSAYLEHDGIDYIVANKSKSRAIADLMARLDPRPMRHFTFG